MKILLIFVLSLCCISAFGQSTLPLRADTVVVEKVGANAELKIKNNTRDSVGGVLTNIGAGRTQFKKSKRLTDSTILVGGDTIKVGTGGAGSIDSTKLYLSYMGDSTITNTVTNPGSLSWNKIQSQRYFKFIDENFIHYRSHFDVGELSEINTLNGTTPTTVNGQLNVVGNFTFLGTNTAPIVPWYSVELDIAAMTAGSGSTTQVGPALIKDVSHYIACTYDNTTDSCRIISSGTTLLSKHVVLPSTNLVLYMVATGKTVAMWAKYSKKTVFIGTAELNFDPTVIGAIDGYKYGMITYSETGSPTQVINSLRGGANGGVGLLNVRMVTNEDGSPYQFGNKVLFTSDWAGIGPWTYNNYTTENATVFAMDLENFQMETVGRIFFNRDDPKNVGVFRITPGAAIKLTWFPSKNKWLMTMNYSDWQNGSSGNTLPSNSDAYAWLDWEAPFGERIFYKSQLQTLGINRTTNPYLDFDIKVAYINGVYYVTGTEARGVNEGSTSWGATGGWPILFSGTDLSNLSLVARSNSTTDFYEAGTFAKHNGNWYVIFSTNGDTRLVLFDLSMNRLDTLNLPYSSNSEIPGYDWLVRQKNGRSEYLLIGYDTKNLTLDGTTYDWSRGELNVFKATTAGVGYEFPNRVANSITMPTKEHRILSSDFASTSVSSGSSSGFGIDSTLIDGNNGSVLFVKSGPILGQDNTLIYDYANKRFGIGGIPTEQLHLKSTTGANRVLVENSSAGGSTTMSFDAINNDGKRSNYGLSSSAYTDDAFIGANSAFLYTDAPGGLALRLANATSTFRVSTGTAFATERFKVDATGNLFMPFVPRSSTTADSVLAFGNSVTGALQYRPVGGAGIYNGARTWTGDYTQNVNHNNLIFDSVDQAKIESIEIDNGVGTRRSRMILNMARSAFSNFNIGGPFFGFTLRKANNASDSIYNLYTFNSGAISIQSSHIRPNSVFGASISASSRADSGLISISVVETATGNSGGSQINMNKRNIVISANDTLHFGSRGIPYTAGGDTTIAFLPSNTTLHTDPMLRAVKTRMANSYLLSDSATGSSIVINLSEFSGFDRIIIYIDKVDVSDDGVELRARFSSDGGSTFLSGASDYEWLVNWRITPNGAGVNGDASDDHITLVQDIGNTPGYSASGEIELLHPFDVNYMPMYKGEFMSNFTTTGVIIRTDHGGRQTSNGIVNAIQFYPSAGTFDKFKYRVIGYKN